MLQRPDNVLLDWFINPDHAPLIVAEQTGLFDKASLNVILGNPQIHHCPPVGRRKKGRCRYKLSALIDGGPKQSASFDANWDRSSTVH